MVAAARAQAAPEDILAAHLGAVDDYAPGHVRRRRSGDVGGFAAAAVR